MRLSDTLDVTEPHVGSRPRFSASQQSCRTRLGRRYRTRSHQALVQGVHRLVLEESHVDHEAHVLDAGVRATGSSCLISPTFSSLPVSGMTCMHADRADELRTLLIEHRILVALGGHHRSVDSSSAPYLLDARPPPPASCAGVGGRVCSRIDLLEVAALDHVPEAVPLAVLPSPGVDGPRSLGSVPSEGRRSWPPCGPRRRGARSRLVNAWLRSRPGQSSTARRSSASPAFSRLRRRRPPARRPDDHRRLAARLSCSFSVASVCVIDTRLSTTPPGRRGRPRWR